MIIQSKKSEIAFTIYVLCSSDFEYVKPESVGLLGQVANLIVESVVFLSSRTVRKVKHFFASSLTNW